ncbi:MAG: AMP-binding protein [Candidatus Rokubacteria bacterium]|nr:AMP-binding protein [Candidatus Rokubacteria bacterium]
MTADGRLGSVTIPQLFRERCARTPEAVAFRVKEFGIYREVTWSEYWERVRQTALGLLELGVEAGDRVAIMGDPCPEWCYADLGAQALGAITYGIYSTSAPSQVRYLLESGGAVVAVAQDQEAVDKILPLAAGLPGLRQIVVADTRAMFFYRDPRLMTFAELLEAGRKRAEREPGLVEERIARGDPGAVAFLVYTSGTSGPPKPAMISHRNCLTALIGAMGEVCPGLVTGAHRTVSFLSMAHILERSLTAYLPLAYDAVPHFGEDVEQLSETLVEAQPTFFCGVPRVWEKIASHVLVGVGSSSWLKRQAYRGAMRVKRAALQRHWGGTRLSLGLRALSWACHQLVFRHILRKVGFLQVRYAVATGAPLPPQVQALWQLWGVDLINLYGSTEAGGVITSQRPGFPRPGDVGIPASVNSVRLGPDGEVLVGGPGVFCGYWQNDGATREAMEGGWLRVGEVAEVDGRGTLKLVDRKRDIMVTAGGKNLAPTNIENQLKSSPYVSEAVVFADGRRYPVALIEIEAATVSEWARAHGVAYTDFASLVGQPRVLELIGREVSQANGHLAQVEQVKKFRLLPKELDPENEDDPLTPTRKVKRRLMYERYRDLVESMYAEAESRLIDAELARLAPEPHP